MQNKIINGDAYELIKGLEDKSIDCIYTDIPYLIMRGGKGYSELSLRIHREYTVDLKDIKNGIDYSILDEFVRVLKKVNCFIWCSKEQIYDIMHYFYTHTRASCTILVWCKTNPTPATNGNWLLDLEYCLYFRESGLPKLNDGYDLKSKFFVSSINVFDKKRYNHPTIKPIELVKRHLLHATQPNDLILDPFSGSGTTCKAAQETGRRYLGFEINEEYYRCSLDRLEGYDATGQRALW